MINPLEATLPQLLLPWSLLGIFLVIAILMRSIKVLPVLLLPLAPLLAWAWSIYITPAIIERGELTTHWPWFPELGIDLNFHLSPLGLWLIHLVLGIGSMVSLYTHAYFKGKREKTLRFQTLLLAFMIAMVGMAISDHLILLFVFWEWTSFLSFLMVGFYYEKEDARSGARRGLLVTAAGGLFMLAGMILLGEVAGTYLLSELPNRAEEILSNPLAPALTLLLLMGALTKSAQVPFHFWLPGAMAAPAPASSYLHSATMVKAGIFLLLLLQPALGEVSVWSPALITFGSITMAYGSWQAIFCLDLKAILANTTLAVLGLLTLMVGIGTDFTIKAAITFLTAHALYKATLFLGAGIIDVHTGTRKVSFLGGLHRPMPWVFLALFLAALSMSGLPGSLGFIAKELVYKALLGTDGPLPILFLLMTVLASSLMIHAALQVAFRPFTGSTPPSQVQDVTTPSLFLQLPVLLLGASGFALGCFPQFLSPLLQGVGEHVLGTEPKALKAWYGVDLALALSAATLTLGVIIHTLRNKWRLGEEAPLGTHSFEAGLLGLIRNAKSLSSNIEFSSLRAAILTVVTVLVTLLVWKILLFGGLPSWDDTSEVHLMPVALCLVTVIGALKACTADTVRDSILFMALCGIGSSLLFMYYGAPDLAITQISVDVLLTILLTVLLAKLPGTLASCNEQHRIINIIAALAFGITITLVVLKSMSLELVPTISSTMGEWSYALAHGRNVVNVILVDFRALDTLGEITVLGIVALGIGALSLRSSQKKGEDS